MKYFLGGSNFLEESLVFPILLFSFVSLHWSLRKAFLSLLAILWNCAFDAYIFPFLLCYLLLFFSQLFVRPLQTANLLFCISFPWGWSWSWTVLWRPTRPLRTNTPKICPFHYRGLECKSRKSRNTWSDRQIWFGIRNEAGQRLIEFCQENALVITNTLFQQHKRRLYTWTSPDDQHQNQTDYILCSQRWRSSIQSTKTTPGADCSSDHELLIAKFRLREPN